MRRLIVISSLLLFSTLAAAQSSGLAPLPMPPQLPRKVQSGQVLDPDPTVLEATGEASASKPPPRAAPAIPDMPPRVVSGDSMEPDITIRRKGDSTIEEYRINGQFYMVKITPAIGPSYYLVDHNGDGSWDSRSNGSDLEKTLKVPQWVLFRW